MSGLIYRITQQNTGKIYIGSTNNPSHRWNIHLQKLLQQTHHNKELQSDVSKYGLDSLCFDLLEILPFSNRQDLLRYEYHWIESSISNGYQCYNSQINKEYRKFTSFCTLCGNPEYDNGLCQEHFYFDLCK